MFQCLRGYNFPKTGTRNKNRVIFEILRSSSFSAIFYLYINCCLSIICLFINNKRVEVSSTLRRRTWLVNTHRIYLSSVLGMTVMSMSVRHFDNMHVMQLLDCRKQSWLHKYASYSSQEGWSPFPDTKKTGYKWFERKSKGTYPNTLITHQGLSINNFH